MNTEENSSEGEEDVCKNCKIFQKQFSYKQQEFSYLKQGHLRLQQVLAEKGSELSHAIRRAETNERELRKFKLRIQQSKKSESLKKVEGKKNK